MAGYVRLKDLTAAGVPPDLQSEWMRGSSSTSRREYPVQDLSGWVGRGLDRSRIVEPPEWTGRLIAQLPGEPIGSDSARALFFRFFPESIQYKFEANLPTEDIGGRAFPAIQDIGSKATSLTMELLFYDVFAGSEDFHSSAIEAREWFDTVVVGATRAGLCQPRYDIFLELVVGAQVQVKIGSVSMEESLYLDSPISERGEAGSQYPQMLSATIEMIRYEPIRFKTPYKSNVASTRGRKNGARAKPAHAIPLPGGFGGMLAGAVILGTAGYAGYTAAKNVNRLLTADVEAKRQREVRQAEFRRVTEYDGITIVDLPNPDVDFNWPEPHWPKRSR